MRIIISAIVIIILIFFLLLLLRSNYITETFVTLKDLPELKNYQGDKLTSKDLEDVINYRSKVSDKYDTIDDPISDSLIPYNPNDKIKLNDYEIIDIFKHILERPPTVNEITKYAYYSNDQLKEYLFNSPEYDKLIKTQNNSVNNGIEGAIARKNIINRINDIYSTIYKDELNVKMMLPLRDCFIHLQMNEFLFAAMLESYNYKKFEVDVLATYVLTKKVLLQLFNKHFNVLELKLLAQDKINNINNQNSKFIKEIENIKKDLLSLGSSSDPQNIIGTIKINFPSVYNELVKATVKNGESADNIEKFDIEKLSSYFTKIEKYQNQNNNDNDNEDNHYYDDDNNDNANDDNYNQYYDDDNNGNDNDNEDNHYYDDDQPKKSAEKVLLGLKEKEKPKEKIIEKLEINKKLKKDIEKLPDDAELYTRIYTPLPRNNSYANIPRGYKPPICNGLGKEQLTQPVFTNSKLLFQGTDLDSAFKDTQVGSIMPKFFYQEYKDVQIN